MEHPTKKLSADGESKSKGKPSKERPRHLSSDLTHARQVLSRLGKEHKDLKMFGPERRSIDTDLEKLGMPLSPQQIVMRANSVGELHKALAGEEDEEEENELEDEGDMQDWKHCIAKEARDHLVEGLAAMAQRYLELSAAKESKRVNMSGICLKRIPPALTSTYGESLLVVDLSNNKLSELEPLEGLRNLRKLNLSNNGISSLPKGFFTLSQLRRLQLSQNNISVISPHIERLRGLLELDVSHNKISEIPIELFSLPQLRTLTLHHNNLDTHSIPQGKELPSSVPSISCIDLSNNKFEDIPTAICSWTNLQELNIANNKINNIRDDLPIAKLQNLLILDLSYNCLTRFTTIASSNLCLLRGLEVLCLSHNDLCMLPDKVWTMKNLCSLKVDGNYRLETEFKLPQRVIQRGTKAIFAHLNPLHQPTESASVALPVLQDTLRRKVDIGTFIQITGAMRDVENRKGGGDAQVQKEIEPVSEENRRRDKSLVKQKTIRGNRIFAGLRGSYIRENTPYLNDRVKRVDPSSSGSILQSLRDAEKAELSVKPSSVRPNTVWDRNISPSNSGEDFIVQEQFDTPTQKQSLVVPSAQWRIETGETTEKYIPPQRVAGGGIQLSDSMIAACQEREEEFSQQQAGHHIFPLDREVTPYYRRFFYKEDHVVFVGNDPQLGPVVVVITTKPDSSDYRWFLLLTQYGSTMGPLKTETRRKGSKRQGNRLLASLLKKLAPNLRHADLQPVEPPEISEQLTTFEEVQILTGFKVGILYCRPGQHTENDLYTNVETSAEFGRFLQFLGDKVALKNWPEYNGGLDTTCDSNGTHSIYTKWNKFEIIFHVSTMMPLEKKSPQQLNRKQHIGNDIVVIVFVEGNATFSPAAIQSKFNHVFFVIRAHSTPEGAFYQLEIATLDGVPTFGPALSTSYNPSNNFQFRELLFTKIINAERAVYETPALMRRIIRTRATILQDLVQTH